MIFVKDAEELRFVRFNKAGEELLGCSREELYGKSSHDLFPREMADLYIAKDREVLRTREPVDIPEDIVQTAHQGERILRSKKIPILDEKGNPQYLLGISEDITERKRAADELERHRGHLEELVGERTAQLTTAKEQAEAANRAKSDFLSSMSHELRTPLNAILGYAQILKRQDNLTDVQKQQLTIMRSSGEHLLTLINDILDVGKIEAQKMEIEEVSFDLTALLVQVFNLTKLNAEEKELRFRYETETPLPAYVRGDERKLRQVLLNLLSNAVKYTRRGGVTLRVSYGRAGAGVLRCEVADTGVGITADKLEAIFEPFTQLVSDKQVREGTGLGLTITKRLLELMGGRIGVKSAPGEGSIFWLEMPLPSLADTDIALEKTEYNVTGYRGARKRILVVDDNIGNTSMLISLLEPLGFTLDTAQNGREAVHLAAERPPDLVLLDLVMPEMDGLEAATLIRRNRELAGTRIIGASATVTESTHKEAFAAACDDFVEKPIRIDTLLEKIGTLLRIEWEAARVETSPEDEGGERRGEQLFVVPPPEELAGLFELAMMGDMSQIETWADALETRNDTYRCFADKLRELAGGFRTKAILALVEHVMGDGNGH
jgi:PAS domain S-box-containing protein